MSTDVRVIPSQQPTDPLDTFISPWESFKTGVKAVWSHYADPWTADDTYEQFDSLGEIAHYITGAGKSAAVAVMEEKQTAKEAKEASTLSYVTDPVYTMAFAQDTVNSAAMVAVGGLASLAGAVVFTVPAIVAVGTTAHEVRRDEEDDTAESFLRKYWKEAKRMPLYDDAAGTAHFVDSVATLLDYGPYAAEKALFEGFFTFDEEGNFDHFGPVYYGLIDYRNETDPAKKVAIRDWYLRDLKARAWDKFPGSAERKEAANSLLGYDPQNPNVGDRWATTIGTTAVIATVAKGAKGRLAKGKKAPAAKPTSPSAEAPTPLSPPVRPTAPDPVPAVSAASASVSSSSPPSPSVLALGTRASTGVRDPRPALPPPDPLVPPNAIRPEDVATDEIPPYPR